MSDEPENDSPARRRLHFQRIAMAAPFEIVLDADRPEGELRTIADAAFDLVEHLEGQLSAYVGTSDISYINETAADRPARIEPRLYALLKTCRRLYEETDGAFDITVGPLLKTWGFYRRAGKMPEPATLEGARQAVGMHHILFDDDAHSVRFDRPGVEINLGAVGKGYVVDRVVEALRGWGIRCALVHSAQSSIAVIGKPPFDEGWRLGVTDPRDRQKALGALLLCDSTMSTSGSWEQFFEHEGRRYSHILDPRTGWPATGILSTTVVAPSATEGDALATAFFVMGVEKARAYCEKHSAVGAVLIAGASPEDFAVHAVNCQMVSPEGMA
ncbi:MAG: FAD:protein FMN transferase [Candidatus Sumerlaeia bacterium]|nr:FAD:protein FMN transferase [Candidatus Sumerlaeia bacterium]